MKQGVHNYISKNTLIKTYKRFLDRPYKVFLIKDFCTDNKRNQFRERHLYTLMSLGLIEEIEAIYYNGKNQRICHNTKGYKLIRKKDLI